MAQCALKLRNVLYFIDKNIIVFVALQVLLNVVVEFGIRFQHIELPFFFVYEDDVIVRVCRLSVAQYAQCATFAHASLPRKYHNDFFA